MLPCYVAQIDIESDDKSDGERRWDTLVVYRSLRNKELGMLIHFLDAIGATKSNALGVDHRKSDEYGYSMHCFGMHAGYKVTIYQHWLLDPILECA